MCKLVLLLLLVKSGYSIWNKVLTFSCLAVIDDFLTVGLAIHAVSLPTSSQPVNADELSRIGIHDRNQRKRECVLKIQISALVVYMTKREGQERSWHERH